MVKTIAGKERRIAVLKKNFDITRYAPARQFSCADWANALAYRANVLRYSREAQVPTVGKLLRSPLVCPNTIELATSPAIAEHAGVRAAACQLHSDAFEDAGDTASSDPIFDALISVNLRATDAVLKRRFGDWLGTKRQEMTRCKAVSPPTRLDGSHFARWFDGGALPCIDLMLFEAAAGFRLPDHIAGSLLFPREFGIDLAERVRKVTRPLASKLISDTFLEALQIQAREMHP